MSWGPGCDSNITREMGVRALIFLMKEEKRVGKSLVGTFTTDTVGEVLPNKISLTKEFV